VGLRLLIPKILSTGIDNSSAVTARKYGQQLLPGELTDWQILLLWRWRNIAYGDTIMNIHFSPSFWRFLFWTLIVNLMIEWILYPLLAWVFSKIGVFIHSWGIDRELQAILDIGLYLSISIFVTSMALYGLELFEVCDFKQMNFPRLPKRLFGEYPFLLALMFNTGISFLILFAIKMSLKQELAKFTLTGALPVG
jgi:hypothetical protein